MRQLSMGNQKQIRYYIASNGKSPFAGWLDKFKDHITRSRIERRIERMASGNYGDREPVGNGVYELRLNFGPGYRVYFAEEDDVIVILLCGGDKSTQKKILLMRSII
jgi:putative addiction module killer protein